LPRNPENLRDGREMILKKDTMRLHYAKAVGEGQEGFEDNKAAAK